MNEFLVFDVPMNGTSIGTSKDRLAVCKHFQTSLSSMSGLSHVVRVRLNFPAKDSGDARINPVLPGVYL